MKEAVIFFMAGIQTNAARNQDMLLIAIAIRAFASEPAIQIKVGAARTIVAPCNPTLGAKLAPRTKWSELFTALFAGNAMASVVGTRPRHGAHGRPRTTRRWLRASGVCAACALAWRKGPT